MKKLKVKQIGPWCDFCEDRSTRATHRQDGWGFFCCEMHKEDLRHKEEADRQQDKRMTEADCQTWMRL